MVVDDKHYAFHMLPSGIVNPKCVAVIGMALSMFYKEASGKKNNTT